MLAFLLIKKKKTNVASDLLIFNLISLASVNSSTLLILEGIHQLGSAQMFCVAGLCDSAAGATGLRLFHHNNPSKHAQIQTWASGKLVSVDPPPATVFAFSWVIGELHA